MMFFAVECINAQSMRDLWLSMPDSIIGYLDKNSRMEVLDNIKVNTNGNKTSDTIDANVKNLLGETSSIDTLTNDYLAATLSSAMKMTIKKLPVDNGDSLLCMIRTYSTGNEKESDIKFFTQSWEPFKIGITIPVSRNGLNVILQQNISSSDIFVIQLQPRVFEEDKSDKSASKLLITLKWSSRKVNYIQKDM